jgi:transcriptional regulator with XRE-family HTH domain
MPKRPDDFQGQTGADLMEAVGRRLGLLLQVIGWDQSQVARMLSVDQSTVNKWIKGKRLQPFYHMITICEQSGCSLDYLYRGRLGRVMREDLQLHLAAADPRLVEGIPLGGPEHPGPGHHTKARAPTS